MKKVTIVPYDPRWPLQFKAEAELLRHALGTHCYTVHHIGSTAVPELSAKPIIDILCVIDELPISLVLVHYDYYFKGEVNVPLRYYFSKKSPELAVNLHVVEPDNGFIALNLAFRDYLRTHEDVRTTYEILKLNISQDPYAGNFVNGLPKYTLEKNAFVKDILYESGFNGIVINFCTHYREWQEYHRIAKEQLFDPYERIYELNDAIPFDINHYYFVLYVGTMIVTIAHVQFLDDTQAALRKLATDEPYKGKGYGKQMLRCIEKWLRYKNYKTIKLHSSLRAAPFYRSLGYVGTIFDDEPSIELECVDLGKELL